ncbi:MAG: SIS domain-containing protein [Candidatus Kapabacteria bacterium]|nr:SIS domain-containing protein [Candidatus Kapabacteria bacterium]
MTRPFDRHRIADIIGESIKTKQRLAAECADEIRRCGELLCATAERRSIIMFCGNGGSAADSQHLAAELVIRLRGNVNRAAIPALALSVDPSIMTAGGNDFGFEQVFARGVEAYGSPGSALVAISTSGTSSNVIRAVEQARSQGVTTIGLLGNSGGVLRGMCDASVVVPSTVTARIQESHILIGHIWCEMIEEQLFPDLF